MVNIKRKIHIWRMHRFIRRELGLVRRSRLLRLADSVLFMKRMTALLMVFVLLLSILPVMLFTGLFDEKTEAAAVTAGPRTVTSSANCVNDASIGTVAWTTPGNAASDNGSYATASLGTATTNYIKCTGFGFNIPDGVVIGGITMTVGKMASAASRILDSRVSLVKGGVVQATDKASASFWDTTETAAVYGSSSDNWGDGTWTASNINATDFGGVFAATRSAGGSTTASVDYMTITIDYSFNPTFTQSAYRWFGNTDTTNPITFASAYGGQDDDMGDYIVQTTDGDFTQTADGGYITAGRTLSYGAGQEDMLIVKYSAAGAVEWAKTWGGTGADYGRDVIQTSDGAYVVVGQTFSYGSGSGDVVILALTSSGALSWDVLWGGTANDEAFSIALANDGNYVVTGSTASHGAGGNDAFLLQITSSGGFGFERVWGGASSDIGYSAAQTTDGGYVISGFTQSFGVNGDVFIVKYTSTGTFDWDMIWGGGSNDYGHDMTATSDGGVAITGKTPSYGSGGWDSYLAKFTSTGTLSWSRTWGGTNDDYGNNVVQTSDGGYAVAGETYHISGGNSDVFLAKYASDGSLSWSRAFVGSGSDSGVALKQTSDGGYAITGYTRSYGANTARKDILLLKYDSTGAITGCSSPLCQSPTVSTTSPSAGNSSPTATTSTVTGTQVGPSVTLGSPAPERAIIVASSPSIDVGSSLNSVAQDTATTALAEQSIFRLRLALHVTTDVAVAGYHNFKLQYAARGADNTCDVSFTNESYADVTASSPIAYANNPNAVDGQTVGVNAGDPTHGVGPDQVVPQEYNETNNTSVMTNILSGRDGLWDFALTDNGAPASTAYCFRMVTDGGATLSTYSAIPQITTLPPNFTQENYRWFKGQDAAGHNTFAQAWGGSNIDKGRTVINTRDNGYAVTGTTASIGSGNYDMFLAKYDASGTLSWTRTWDGGTGNYDEGMSLIQTADGGYAVTGTATIGAAGTDREAFIAKYDASGTLDWTRSWGTAGIEDTGQSIAQGENGDIVITGSRWDTWDDTTYFFLTAFTSSGTLRWAKNLSGSGFGSSGEGVVSVSGGGYAVSGSTDSYGAGASDLFLARYDLSGNLLWFKTWGGTGSDYAKGLIQTSDGGYALTGYSFSYPGAVLLKYDSSGSLSWARVWGSGTTGTQGNSVVQTSDGGFALAGQTGSYGVGSNDMFLAKYDSSGTLSWSRTWGAAAGSEYGNSLVRTPDGGYAVAGEATAFGAGNADSVLVKFDTDGSILGCTSTMCTSPSPAVSSPSATVTSPAATSPALVGGSATTPTVQTTSSSATVTSIVGWMTFVKTWGATGVDFGNSMVPTSDGGYVITGEKDAFGTAAGDMFLAKYDSSGTLSWSRTWGGASEDTGRSVVQTSDGGYAVVGSTDTYGAGSGDMFLAKYDSSGTLSWSRTWGEGFARDTGYDIVQTTDGGYAVTGSTKSYSDTTNGDVFLAKYDSSGTLSWSRTWGGTGTDTGYSIVQTTDGGYAITGSTISFGVSTENVFLAKYDSSGTLSWSRTWGGSASADHGYSLIQTSDGGYAVTGQTVTYGTPSGSLFLAKYDSSGTLSWSKVWSAANSSGKVVVQTSDGGYALAGNLSSGGNDVIVVKLDANGDVGWSRTWGGTGSDSSYAFAQTTDGGFAVMGMTYSYGDTSNGDAFLAKYDPLGQIAGCPGTMCQTSSPVLTSPSATTATPSSTVSSPSATTNSPTASTGTPTVNDTYHVAKAIAGSVGAVTSTPLAAQDASGTSSRYDDPLRLRITLKNAKRALGGLSSMKLQVAHRVGTCDLSFTGESYVDVGTANAAFTYYDNPGLTDALFPASGSGDPVVPGTTKYYENYVESAPFSNRRYLVANQYGLWDFALTPTDTSAPKGSYCFRVVQNDDSQLFGYSYIAELNLNAPAPKQQMRHGKFFDTTSETGQPFYW